MEEKTASTRHLSCLLRFSPKWSLFKKVFNWQYFEEISQDTGKCVFGVEDTLKVLEMGAFETLILWETLDMTRYTLKNSSTGEIVIKHLNKDQENYQSNFFDQESKAELEVQEKLSLLEWFANEYGRFGCTLEFVTNKSQEGSQFCQGFGGIGGILRYQLDVRAFDDLMMIEKFMTMMIINQPTSQTQVRWLNGRSAPVCVGSHVAVLLEGKNFGRNLDSHG